MVIVMSGCSRGNAGNFGMNATIRLDNLPFIHMPEKSGLRIEPDWINIDSYVIQIF